MVCNGTRISSSDARSGFRDINHAETTGASGAAQTDNFCFAVDAGAQEAVKLKVSETSEQIDWESSFPTPFVYREGTKISLHFQIDAAQSMMDDTRPESLVFNYTRLMMAVLLFVPDPIHLGCIGLGGGSIPKYCHRYLPHTRVSVAEINPQVIALRDEFHIPRDSFRFGVFQMDGAEFVTANPDMFDVLMVDAFDFNGQPPHLCSTSFYQSCFAALTANGYLVVNLCHPGKDKAIIRMEQAFQRPAYRLNDPDGSNVIAIVGKKPISASLPSLPARARTLEMQHPLFFREMLQAFAATSQLRMLPVELL